jgi:FkbM family methyltransferase
MLLDPSDYVSDEILETGRWEPECWAAIKEHLPIGGTFIDVGAHIGYFSLKAAKIVGATGRVIAIEANPDTVRKLCDNVKASGATTIAVQPVACADSDGVLELFASRRCNTGKASLSRDNAVQPGSASSVYHVRARPLDTIVQEISASGVDVIKIDVEGAELLVLRGAQQTLARYSPVLILELIDKLLQSMGTSAADVMEFLHCVGYRPRQRIGENMVFAK